MLISLESGRRPSKYMVTMLGWYLLGLASEQFRMPDRYVNQTRPQLPAECKVSELAQTLLRVAERVILANGGERITPSGQPGYRIKVQTPAMLEPLPAIMHRPEGVVGPTGSTICPSSSDSQTSCDLRPDGKAGRISIEYRHITITKLEASFHFRCCSLRLA